ncbi:50S ribosomal protein L4 [Candidatus Roizmanbacteria bacterium CG_4_10_14_0_8_um_filter_33_9]|uniref:Large ribosomal subunit protein uL4 n=1 Tax=Candidatus Roizmanbacteria bacterium CG_4_10_14_0_8_um_filter_33_9 TaxID=1974826 RepID=A0A2M7QGQ4_9BACT|nr:MAG: 50S ribosomal protein L4 [Candidatus Roizmanbacteria bacterium CG_4_10_14_0_8_um_filter_33_9]
MEKSTKEKISNLKIPVYNLQGEVVKDISFPKKIYTIKISLALIAQYIKVYTTNQRQGNASAKTRAEVQGTTKKVYKQKGTGRARHGSMKAPIFKGGGVVGGPLSKEYALKMNKKQKRQALFYALTSQHVNKNIIALGDEFLNMKINTNKISVFLKKVFKNSKKILVIIPKTDNSNLFLSLRNISNVYTTNVNNINPYMLLVSNKIIFLEKSLSDLENLLIKKNEN